MKLRKHFCKSVQILRVVSTLVFLICSNEIFAANLFNMTSSGSPFNGFYLGGALGYEFIQSQIKVNYFASVSHGDTLNTINDQAGAYGFTGGGFVGYGQVFNNIMYLAIEAFDYGENANVKNQFVSTHFHAHKPADIVGTSDQVSMKNSYGVSILPGIKANNNSLFYARLGYRWSQFSIKEKFIFFDIDSGLPLTNTSLASSQTKGGFNYGLGVDTAIFKNLSLRLEVNHTQLNSLTTKSGNKFNISENQALVGLRYGFA